MWLPYLYCDDEGEVKLLPNFMLDVGDEEAEEEFGATEPTSKVRPLFLLANGQPEALQK